MGLVTLALASANIATATESIAYRLPEWKEMHFDDARKAEQHLAAVKKLGCETQLNSHNGHTDVVYRAVRWQSMEVANDKLAHQWQDWMNSSGFETLHGHSADHGTGHDPHDGHDHAGHSHEGHNHDPGQAEEVSFVMQKWQTLHVNDVSQAPEIAAILKGLGCEVRSENHDDHTDVFVRCQKWKHVELSSHRTAQIWEGWLKQQGFTVKHEH